MSPLFPRINFPEGASAYWGVCHQRDDGWWTSWYDRYHRYMMQVADWAALTGVKPSSLGPIGKSIDVQMEF